MVADTRMTQMCDVHERQFSCLWCLLIPVNYPVTRYINHEKDMESGVSVPKYYIWSEEKRFNNRIICDNMNVVLAVIAFVKNTIWRPTVCHVQILQSMNFIPRADWLTNFAQKVNHTRTILFLTRRHIEARLMVLSSLNLMFTRACTTAVHLISTLPLSQVSPVLSLTGLGSNMYSWDTISLISVISGLQELFLYHWHFKECCFHFLVLPL